MNNQLDEIIKNKINNYMEQIKVPENLGGIIMEDFEKIKNEETNQTRKTKEEKPKGKKVFKISIASIAAVALIGVGIFTGARFLGKKVITLDNNGATNNSMASNNIQNIDEEKLNNAIKRELIKLAEKEYSSNKTSSNTFSEGHIVLRSEIKDNKIYSYILAEYGVYSTQNTTVPQTEGSASGPLTLVFEVSSSNEYDLIEIKQPQDGENYGNSLKSIFPEDLLSAVKDLPNGKYTTEINNQILKYIEIALINQNKNTQENKKTQISDEESKEILKLLNGNASTSFVCVNYDKPENLFKEVFSPLSADSETLAYAIMNSDYSTEASSEEVKILANGREEFGSFKVITEENLIKLFKEKTNYTYSKDTLRKAFNYNEKIKKYFAEKYDDLHYTFTIKSGYKINDKYYLTLPNPVLTDGKDVELVVSKIDNIYYFYSCKVVTKNLQTSNEEDTSLLNFLNDSVNNPFTQIKYQSPEKLFDVIDKSDSYPLRYAVFDTNNTYCTALNNQQKDQLRAKYDSVDEVSWYFISEENLIKFLQEKMNYTYSKETLRKVFRYEEKVNGYIDIISDTTYSKVTIKSVTKNSDNSYYLTLKSSEKEIFISIIKKDGKYCFQSCNF